MGLRAVRIHGIHLPAKRCAVNPFLDKIAKHREELQRLEAEVRQKLDEIERKRVELETAEKIYREFGGDESPVRVATQIAPSSANTTPPAQLRTVKQAIVESLLANYPHGMQGGEIRNFAKTRFGYDINPHSFTTIAGRLKADHLIRLDGRNWFLAKAPDVVRRNVQGEPGAGAPGDLLSNN